jgi:hypothetical protein
LNGKYFNKVVLIGLFLILLFGCAESRDRRILPASLAGLYFSERIEEALKEYTTYQYFDRQLGIRIIPLLMLPDTIIFLNEEKIAADQVGERIDSLTSGFSTSEKRTFNVHLRVHGDTGMRIVSEVKEQLKMADAIRIIYSREDISEWGFVSR